MLVLSTLHKVLEQLVSPQVPNCVLLTPAGHIVASASAPQGARHEQEASSDRSTEENVEEGMYRAEDVTAMLLTCVATEIWRESPDEDMGFAQCSFGRVAVAPVPSRPKGQSNGRRRDPPSPTFLLAVHARDEVEYEDLEKQALAVVRVFESESSGLASLPISDSTGWLGNQR